MAALNASVEKAKKGRGEDEGGDATVHEMKPRKKAASKKAPAKKPAAKKATGKKAAGKSKSA